MTTVTLGRNLAKSRRPPVSPVAAGVAMLSLLAAGIHLSVVPEHREHWWVYGVFFLACGLAQALFALVVYRWPRPSVLIAGIVGNLGVALLWMWSRTFGLPVGPPVPDFTAGRGDPNLGGYGSHASGALEPIGLLDLTSTVLELAMVVALVSLLAPKLRRRAVNVALGVALVLWTLRLVGPTG